MAGLVKEMEKEWKEFVEIHFRSMAVIYEEQF